ncbi:O-antigen ligase family protein [Gracilimonas sp.]|uniref:O-antigen ligase family protein n=1 Tax=Gracilimonas sp. TaxID=1974203 RepID=UPI0032EF8BF6
MLTIDRLFNGVVLVAPLLVGALLTGVIFVGEEGSTLPASPFQIMLGLTFLFFVAKKAIFGDWKIELYGLEGYYLVLLGIIFLSITYTPDREEALIYVVRLIVLLGMTYLIYNSVDSSKELIMISYLSIGVAVLIAAQNLVQIYFNPDVAAYNYASQGAGKLMRSSAEGLDPNIFAINYAFPLMMLVAYFNKARKTSKQFVIFGLILVIIGSVLLTYSRSSWVSIALGIGVLMFLSKNYRFLLFMSITFAIAFSISGTVQQLTLSFLERFIDIFAGASDDSSKFRILLAETAVLIILDSYLMGIGFQGFSTVFKTYHPPETTLGIYEPHNQFYSVFAELGIIGFAIFMLILFHIGRRAYQSIQHTDLNSETRTIAIALFATFISYLVFYNFLGGMFFDSILFVVIGLIFATNKVLQRNNSQGIVGKKELAGS